MADPLSAEGKTRLCFELKEVQRTNDIPQHLASAKTP